MICPTFPAIVYALSQADTHIAEHDESELAQLGDARVRGLGLQEELREAHLLAAVQRAHRVTAGRMVATAAQNGREGTEH